MSQQPPYPPSGQYQQPNQSFGPPPHTYQQQAPAPKRRKVWPWVLLAVVLVPILGFVACTALVGGAVKAVDDARQGGTVEIGQSFTYAGGIGLATSPLKSYKPSNPYSLQQGEVAYETTVTVTNGTKDPIGAVTVTKSATVNGAPAGAVFDEGSLATQDIAPGQQLAIPFHFKVKRGTTGPVQISVAAMFNEPVFFTGKIG